MTKLGYEHLLASNGLQALEAYKTAHGKINIILMGEYMYNTSLWALAEQVILDMKMPLMDGLTATREIRSYERANSIPPATIVSLSGIHPSTHGEARRSGVNGFLNKPTTVKDLKALLEGWRSTEKPVTEEEGESS
jgi:CheY-like chemotaxis protein